MAKLDIDFVLIDESVVMNGFRCLMAGAKLQSFQKNPVMLCMHSRAESGAFEAATTDVILPIGKWYDIRVIDDKLLAKPDFDDADEFAKRIEGKVLGGYMKGASIWIEPIAVSDDASLQLAGQPGPTITKWGILEASIVDIPNCRNSLAIKNSAGKKIVLSGNEADPEIVDYLKTFIKNTTMDRKLLCANVGLPETATDAQISEKLAALKSGAENLTQLSAQNKTLADEVVRLKKEATEKTITDLVDSAIGSKKILAGDRDKFLRLAAADFDTVKELIDGMKPYNSIEAQLGAGKSTADQLELDELLKLSATDMYMTGKLARLKELDMEQFKLKYKEALGVPYVEA